MFQEQRLQGVREVIQDLPLQLLQGHIRHLLHLQEGATVLQGLHQEVQDHRHHPLHQEVQDHQMVAADKNTK